MATITRQPFAPLDGARLQRLTSMKNQQNAIATPKGKRKAESIENDDSENVDPVMFAKRSKGGDSFFGSKDMLKPSSFTLTKAASVPSLPAAKDTISNTLKPASISRPRTLLQPKSPAARLNTSFAKASPLSAPAGRSPTRGSKRVGLLSNRRRTASSFSRVDPPAFGLGNAAPFSLDAALKGTISSYASRPTAAATPAPTVELSEPDMKSSWFFVIHEDTPEQEMTNLLQHSTCTLDISSDEESEQRARREKAEGRDKENIPPADDVSQTTTSRAAAARAEGPIADEMVVEKTRDPLGALNVEDFYAKGCDAASVILIPEDEEEEVPVCVEKPVVPEVQVESSMPQQFDFTMEVKHEERSIKDVVNGTEPATAAALLEPMEGTGESFELWESGSAKDDAEPAPSTPRPVEEPILDVPEVEA